MSASQLAYLRFMLHVVCLACEEMRQANALRRAAATAVPADDDDEEL